MKPAFSKPVAGVRDMTRKILFSAALLLLAPPAMAQDATLGAEPDPPATATPLSLEQRMLLRCSAAIALVANRQQSGEQWALAFPPLATRGQEFFVQAGALLMDEAGIDSATLGSLLASEAQDMVAAGELPQMMPVCLPLLDQSGL